MSETINLTVWGEPVPKARPRFSRQAGGKVRVHSDPESASYELKVKASAFGLFEDGPLTGPLRVTVHVYVPIPASWPKSKQVSQAGAPCIVKPDLDNYIKTLDGLNGVAWVDDGQICRLMATKAYSHDPRMEIIIEKI